MATVSYSWDTTVVGFTLNDDAAGNQADVAIAATADGGYLGAWSVGSVAVEGRYVDAEGTPGVESLINTTLNGLQFDASMALLGNGHNVVSFTDSSSGTNTVRIRILGDGAPATDFVVVPGSPSPLRESDVTALGADGFAVAFTRDFGGGDTDILVQRYEADGDQIGGIIVVDNAAGLATDHASIVDLASGGFVVAWEQSATAGGDHSVWFQLYDALGVPVTVAGDPPGGHHLIDSAGSINQDIQVAALQDGGFVVAYTDNGWGTGTDITARVYNADGTARTTHLLVNTDTALDQLRPTITVLSNGFFVVGWTDVGTFRYQAYDPAGNAIGSNFGTHTNTIEGEIAALADGQVASVRESDFSDGDGNSVRSSVHALTRSTIGTAAGETLTGDSLRDNISGSDGNDTLDGGAADDTLFGGLHDDVLRGGAGGDQLFGSVGSDTASYYTSVAGVAVDLAAGTGSVGDAAGDFLVDIENLSGSNLGNDILAGNSGANKLQGWGGDDVLRGGAGADTLEGGAGTDTASYYSGATGVAVNLGAGTASGGDAAGDMLSGIENLSGSNLGGDILTGNAGANVLQGWGGNDALVGGAGKDTLTGGAGLDRIYVTALGDSVVGANADAVTDFSQAQGDEIDVSLIDANTGAAGNQAFSFIGTAVYTGVAGQLRFSIVNGVTTIAGDVNGDQVSDFHIILTGSIALVAGDFVL
ncbi:hypothetical protein [Inquilinus sp. CA228]|uniref:hypothetical protein n=1 Tax=Inquilinus sp. CA228 TaxID=3455609 RepID=UPI003F8D506A